eukprot:GHRR01036577.1.p1 GENE.GHRR01036577.1~~GHRR01036577.1.p1  ORF type:complete len:476 (+),score=107.28 GHRR01036577.1:532-1959(+)
MWSERSTGFALAVSSSAFIGSSFVIKKRGLRAAGATGIRAGAGGFGYLREPVWWAGLLCMVIGELANFAAYAFAPAILVTPLGALSIIISAVLAHIFLREHLNIFGILGCILCITGSVAIVLHAPVERPVESVIQVWNLAMQPGFLLYSIVALGVIFYLTFWVSPKHGSENVLVYLGICSLAGSFTVISCKALGVALKLTIQGDNQMIYVQFYFFLLVRFTAPWYNCSNCMPIACANAHAPVAHRWHIGGCTLIYRPRSWHSYQLCCCDAYFPHTACTQHVLAATACMQIVVACLLTQMNYLNKALDLFNTAVVSPIYYVMFTLLTIVASVIMFQDYQTHVQMATEACGFITIVSGTFLLHTTKDLDVTNVDLEELVRSNSASGDSSTAAANGGSSALGIRSVRERRSVPQAVLEMGKLTGSIELKIEQQGKGSGGDRYADDEHHPLLNAGGSNANAGNVSFSARKQQRPGPLGL